MKKRRYILVGVKAGQSLTNPQKVKVRDTISGMAMAWQRGQPNELFQLRQSADNEKAIYEVCYPEAMTLAQMVAAVAAQLGIATGVLLGKVDFTVFDEDGTEEGSRLACVAYMLANGADWDGNII